MKGEEREKEEKERKGEGMKYRVKTGEAEGRDGVVRRDLKGRGEGKIDHFYFQICRCTAIQYVICHNTSITRSVCTRNMYPHHAPHCAACVVVACLTGACKCIDSEFESVELVDHTHFSTLHEAALALQTLTAPLTHNLASFPSPNQHVIIWCGAAV